MKKLLALLLSLVMVMGCFTAFAEGGKETVVVMDQDIGDISPFGASGAGRNYIKYMLYENLAQSKNFGDSLDQMSLIMAKKIDVVDDVTFNVEIYDNIFDTAGNQIKASDVVFSFVTMAASGNYEKVKSNLASVTALDDYTVEIKLVAPKIGMMEYMVGQVIIVSEKSYNDSTAEALATNPITTGPYVVAELVSGSHIVLGKNENYWQKDDSLKSYMSTQPIDKITLKVVAEAAQRAISLETKNADMVTSVASSDISRFLNGDNTAKEGYNVATTMGGLSTVLMFNCDNGSIFDNQALRQAVCYAIDKEALVLGALRGAGRITNTFSTPLAADYNPAWDAEDYYNFDLDKAQAMLKESGVNASDLKLRIMVGSMAAHKSTAEIIQAYLLQLGINSEIMVCDNALFNSYKYDSTQWDIIIDQKGTTDFVVNTWSLTFDSTGFANGTANFVHDDAFQALLMEACGIDTHNAETVEAFHQYLKEKAYGIGLYVMYTYSVATDKVEELVVHPQGQLIPGACVYAEDYQSVVK